MSFMEVAGIGCILFLFGVMVGMSIMQIAVMYAMRAFFKQQKQEADPYEVPVKDEYWWNDGEVYKEE